MDFFFSFFFFFPPYSRSLIFPHHNRTDSYMHFNMVIIQQILNINRKGGRKKKLVKAFKMVFSHRSLHINTTRASPASWLGGFIQGIYSPYLLLCLLAGVLFTVFSPSFGWFANVINVVNEWGCLLFKKNIYISLLSTGEHWLFFTTCIHSIHCYILQIKHTFGKLSVQICFFPTEHTHLEMGK